MDIRAAQAGDTNYNAAPDVDQTIANVLAPIAATLPATDITFATATLNGTVLPNGAPAEVYYQYGSDTNYGSLSGITNIASETNTAIPITLTGLTPGATYHYQLVAQNSAGTAVGRDLTFTTTPPAAPGAVTLPATFSFSKGADLIFFRGLVTPNYADTFVWFQYGPTTNYGSVSFVQEVAGNSTAAIFGNGAIFGVQSIYGYHYQLVASNSVGVSYGGDLIFDKPPTQVSLAATGIGTGTVAFGDFDRDGLLDFALAGGRPTQAWRNQGGNFAASADPIGVWDGVAALGDSVNANQPDILVLGVDPLSSAPVAKIWRYGGGTVTNSNFVMPPNQGGSVLWGDFDNDGRQDILFCGFDTNGSPVTQIWRNLGGGVFTNQPVNLPVASVASGAVAVADFDGDGYLDILFTGLGEGKYASETTVWRNLGNWNFAAVDSGLPSMFQVSLAVADFDNDGYPDILMSGQDGNFNPVVQIWRNLGDGTFTNLNATLTALKNGAVAVGDYNNDGRVDVLLTGYNFNLVPTSVFYENLGGGFFADFGAGLPGVEYGSVALGDINNDGRLDILISGANSQSSESITLWQNQCLVTNTAPTAPAGLVASLGGTGVVLSWTAASDAQTPAAGLSYNVRVGTTPGGSDVISPEADPVTGKRYVPAMGNAQERLFSILTNLVGGQTYYWSVQAIDGAFAGSPFAAEQSFICTAPPPLVITWPNPAPIVYGAMLDGNELNASANIAGNFEYSPTNGAALDAGTNSLSVTFVPADTNYATASRSVTLVVLPASLSVTANNAVRLYGTANPAFSDIITGLVNGDQITATNTCAATPASPVGIYAIIPGLIDLNKRLRNYAVSTVNGTLTVALAPVATTHSATAVTSTSAVLNGTVNPDSLATVVYFIWGGNTNLAVNLPAGNTAVNVSNLLTSLAPHTAYAFQVMAVNALGTTLGTPLTVTTPGTPEVENVLVGAVTTNSATLNGMVTARGASCGAWFEWGTTTNYGQTTVVTNIGNGWPYLAVSNVLTGLASGTIYHFRMLATNSVGVTNSADVSFTVPPAAPVATTHSATGVTSTSAVLNGTVNPVGLATAVYFVWGPGSAASYTNLAVNLPAGAGMTSVSNLLTGLAPHTAYGFEIMAVNAAGTNLGAQFSFTTPGSPEITGVSVSAVNTNSAVLNGSVTARGASCGAWFVWGTTTNYGQTTLVTNIGNGWPYLAVSNVIAGLNPGTTYHFRMFATNSVGNTNSANYTLTTPSAPAVVTHSATAVTSTSATLNGTVTPNGLATAVYFVWGPAGVVGNTNLAANLPAGTASVNISNLLTGLAPHTAYAFEVMAVNALGTNYGALLTLTTPGTPELENVAISDVTTNSVMLNGMVTARGAACGAWFAWGTTTNYGRTTLVTNIGNGWPYLAVSNALTGLIPGTTYHFQMLATNSVGGSNSADIAFTLPPGFPTAVTHSASDVTSTSATLNGTINPVGLATAVYFIWGPGVAMGNTNLAVNLPAGTASINISNLLTGLLPHTAYNFQVMAVNAQGANFGAQLAFTTPDSPELKNIGASNVTSTTAALSGLVTARGSTSGAGFAWGVTTNYGQTTSVTNIGNGWPYVTVSNLITGLTPGTKYHYRMFATNSYGSSNSVDLVFTTPASSKDIVDRKAGKPVIGSVQILDVVTLADGTRRVDLTATPGQTYVIEAAGDPASPAWTIISTNTASASGEFSFLDPQSSGAAGRFYRLRGP